MAVLTEESAAEKSNFKNSRGNGYGLRLRQRHFSGSVLTATTTTRKTDQDTATTATEKTTLNQVHSGPKTGSTSLRAAYSRFQGEYDSGHRLLLATAQWQIIGPDNLPTVVDWYYAELERKNWETWAMARVLKELAATRGRDGRKLMKAIILDRRFDTLNWKAVEQAARIVNSYSAKAAIPEEELSAAYSPNGFDFHYGAKDEAMKQYPRETKLLLDQLARWRSILRSRMRKV